MGSSAGSSAGLLLAGAAWLDLAWLLEAADPLAANWADGGWLGGLGTSTGLAAAAGLAAGMPALAAALALAARRVKGPTAFAGIAPALLRGGTGPGATGPGATGAGGTGAGPLSSSASRACIMLAISSDICASLAFMAALSAILVGLLTDLDQKCCRCKAVRTSLQHIGKNKRVLFLWWYTRSSRFWECTNKAKLWGQSVKRLQIREQLQDASTHATSDQSQDPLAVRSAPSSSLKQAMPNSMQLQLQFLTKQTGCSKQHPCHARSSKQHQAKCTCIIYIHITNQFDRKVRQCNVYNQQPQGNSPRTVWLLGGLLLPLHSTAPIFADSPAAKRHLYLTD